MGHGAATTSPEYVESYTQMMDEPADINYLTGDKVPPNQKELLRQADMPTNAIEAAKRHTNPKLVNNPIPDAKKVDILKSPLLTQSRKQVLAKRLGQALKFPVLGGAIAAGSELIAGGDAQAAATAFVDAENVINGGALGDATLEANQNPQPVEVKPLLDIFRNEVQYIDNQIRNGTMPYLIGSLRMPSFF